MSAIFGVVNWHGADGNSWLLDRLGKSLEPRGDRPPRVWMRDGAGLGHCMLIDTPEAADEVLPKEHPEAQMIITWDARIDNRAELVRTLLPAGRRPETVSNSDLILLAFLEWGEQCAERLLGDFAFAIWDSRNRKLFCCRDHFGVKPLYYVSLSDGFAFASEIAPLLSIPGVSCAVDRETVAEFMGGMREDGPRTFYAGVSRLPPGHTLTVSENGLAKRQYYRLGEHSITEINEPEEQFVATFEAAVARRMRGVRDPICMLSGGLDSSSITSMANRLATRSGAKAVKTISRMYPGEGACDETPFIDAVIQAGRYQPHYHNAPSHWSLDSLLSLTHTLSEPTHGLGMFGNGLLYPAVRGLGSNVVLDGHGGDEVLSQPNAFLRELAENDRWIPLAREWMPLARDHNVPVWPSFLRLAASYGTLRRLRSGLDRWGRERGKTTTAENEGGSWSRHIDRRLVSETDLLRKRAAWRQRQPDWTNSSQAAHLRLLANTGQSLSFESLNQVALRSGVEPRYPFWDKELVELCLALPPTLKMKRGWTRYILRSSLRDILPDKVRWRRSKTSFTSPCARALQQVGERNLRDLVAAQDSAAPVVSKEWYGSALDKFFSGDASVQPDLSTLWRCIAVLAWLQGSAQQQAELAHRISQISTRADRR